MITHLDRDDELKMRMRMLSEFPYGPPLSLRMAKARVTVPLIRLLRRQLRIIVRRKCMGFIPIACPPEWGAGS